MSDPELQKLTASESLTLEQEYEMQETWRNDEDSKKLFYFSYSFRIRTFHTIFFINTTKCLFILQNVLFWC